MDSSAIVLKLQGLSKAYSIYDRPIDRLKQMLAMGRKRYYREFWALKNIDLEVRKGEFIGVIGKNGSGKSTLLQLICGTLNPTSGTIDVNGRISALLELGAGFNPEFSGRENVFINGAILGVSQQDMEKRFDSIAAFADIGDFIDQPVKVYSSGMYVRLAFAVAIHVEPDILIVDEALAVGDVFFQQKCHKRIEEMVEKGITIILVTHGLGAVEKYADRVLFLDKGECMFLGDPVEGVMRYYQHERFDSDGMDESKKQAGSPLNRALLPVADGEDSPDLKSIDLSRTVVIGDTGKLQCEQVSLSNSEGLARRSFEIGEDMVFEYTLKVLDDIKTPVAGIEIINAMNVIMHAKNSLCYEVDAPPKVSKGSLLKLRLTVKASLCEGEYTFSIAFFEIDQGVYRNASHMSSEALYAHTFNLFRIMNVAKFTIIPRSHGIPVPFAGNVDLDGSCTLEIIET